jgi:type I restriction enzyme S subunit
MWTTRTLGDVCDEVDGVIQTGPFGSQLHESDYVNDGIPVVMPKNIVDGKVDISDIAFINQEDADRLERHKMSVGDIVYGRRGDIGRRALVGPREHGWLCGTGCLRVSLGDRILDPTYLYYFLGQPIVVNWIANQAVGATMPNLNTGILRSVAVRYPRLPIQRRIASILSAYDDLIENNTRRIKILEEMAQMLYREWFVNFRFPGHRKVKMVESELGQIPATWTVEPLEEVCSRVTDGSHWSPQTVQSAHLMASSKDMHTWGLTLSTCRTIAKEDYDTLVRNDCKPLAGDVLITKDGANYLKFCFAVEKDMEVVLLSSVAMIRPDPIRASSHFLAFYLSDEPVKTRLAGRVSGAAIPRIVLKDLRQFKILVPPVAIQNGFVQIVEPVVALCWRLIEKNTNLRTTRDFLLPKLISGEIPVEAATEPVEQTA